MSEVRSVYFGVRWDAPAFEDAIEVPTPVGEACLMCQEPVDEGESGVLTPYLGDLENGPDLRAVHIECWLRSLLGSVAHLEGRCTCFGGSIQDYDDRPYRVVARETMAWIVERGR